MYLQELVKNNPNIENKEYILVLLEYLEKIIPLEYKDNLYRNISNCTIKLNLNSNLKIVLIEKNKNYSCCNYDVSTNSLIMKKEGLKILKEKSKNERKPEEYYKNLFLHYILHELIHLASTKRQYDFCIDTGVLDLKNNNYKKNNTAINEGITEMIANIGLPIDYENEDICYFIEYYILSQISTIIGYDTMIDSYFGNKGINIIKEELTKIIDDEEFIESIFEYIEVNFDDFEKNLVPLIQDSLMSIFFKKIDNIINNNELTYEELEDYINIYEQYLVTPNILKINSIKIYDESDLIGSVSRFTKYKNKALKKYQNKNEIKKVV